MPLQDTAAAGGPPPAARKVISWLQEMRLPFLVVTVLPVLFGAVVAWSTHTPVNPGNFVLAFFGAVFMHLGANVINDYFDYHNGTDAANVEYIRGFTGGSRAIQDGRLSYREVLAGATVFLAAAAAIILCLTARSGSALLFMGMAALAAAVTYSLFLHAFIVGELAVGLCFGTLIPAGSFFAQTGFVSREVVFASLPMGALVFLILFINEIPDYAADKNSGKKTLVVRLGRKRAAFLYCATLAAVYAYIAATGFVLRMPVLLLSFLTFPTAFMSATRLLKYYEVPGQLRPSIVATITLFTLNSLVLLAAFTIRGAA